MLLILLTIQEYPDDDVIPGIGLMMNLMMSFLGYPDDVICGMH
jgi:hypothetical protein